MSGAVSDSTQPNHQEINVFSDVAQGDKNDLKTCNKLNKIIFLRN